MSDDTFQQIGFEHGLPVGFSSAWSGLNGAGNGVAGWQPDGHGSNFFMIPAGKRVTRVYGTCVVKHPGVELLFRVVAGMGNDCDTIVQEHTVSLPAGAPNVTTLTLNIENLPSNPHLTGDGWKAVWVEWQAINNSGSYTGSGSAFEIQLNFVVE